MHLLHMIAQGLVVLAAIYLGARTGGIGLGIWGLAGLLVLVVGLHTQPGQAPSDAVFMVITVITAASVMQAAGGVDWMVRQAARMIHGRPGALIYLAPLATFLFAVSAGTSNIYYPLLPVIYDVAYAQKLRPSSVLSVSAVAAQAGVLASPVSAATASLSGLLGPQGFSLSKILLIMWPACIAALLVASFVMSKHGKPLAQDPEYQRRLAAGQVSSPTTMSLDAPLPACARTSALIFFAGLLFIEISGPVQELRPYFSDGRVSVTVTTEMVMGSVGALIFLLCRVEGKAVYRQSTFTAGMAGAIALFGVSWLASTFVAANEAAIGHTLGQVVSGHTWLFAIALALVAMLTTSNSAATSAIVPIGLSAGLSPALITAMWPATMGIYILPANGSQVSTVSFDETGSTRIGRFLVNHSFQLPTLIVMGVGIAVGLLISELVLPEIESYLTTTSVTGREESAGMPSEDGATPRATISAPSAATMAPLSVHSPGRGTRSSMPPASQRSAARARSRELAATPPPMIR
jgi:anaerobic C4-dicarboxylate transporter DcuA/anaerobic C4-dicarboxylate transporter DcuB